MPDAFARVAEGGGDASRGREAGEAGGWGVGAEGDRKREGVESRKKEIDDDGDDGGDDDRTSCLSPSWPWLRSLSARHGMVRALSDRAIERRERR